jgi:hypothetical protein
MGVGMSGNDRWDEFLQLTLYAKNGKKSLETPEIN